jgi:hypothetical protein
MKGGRRRGERGTFFSGNVFFIVEWLGGGSPGVIVFYKFIVGGGVG